MTTNDYKPVSCEFHSELELAIMHRKELSIIFLGDDKEQRLQGHALDIFTRNKQEFLLLRTCDQEIEIRLDKIITC